MRRIFMIAVAASLGLSACGVKGNLKSPAQIEAEQQKKAKKAGKGAKEQATPPNPPPQGEGD